MASIIRQDYIDFFMETVKKYEPYPVDEYKNMLLDDTRFEDGQRRGATISLIALLNMGYSEDEVNPWKK